MYLSHPTHQALQPGQEVSTSGEILAYPARVYPEKTGLICGTRSWTFAELNRIANQFAHAVITRFADQDGPIGIMGSNSAEYAIAHFGTSRTGRYSINFPTRCTADDLIYTMRLTKPVVFIVDIAYLEIAKSAMAQLEEKPFCVAIGEGEFMGFWNFIKDQPDTLPAIDIDADAGGSIIFTGGTTGKPKAVLASPRARAISAMAALEDFRIQSNQIAGYSVPFTHTAGLFSWFQPAVLAACTGIIIPKWDPKSFMDLTETHGINVIFAVPSQLATLLDHPAFDPERLRTLQMIAFGGSPISRSLIERAEQVMPWLECARAYGSTETGHLAAQCKADRELQYEGYNQPGGRLEIEIFKEPGVIAEEGETGELATRGAHLMLQYLDNDEANTAFFKSDISDGQWGWMGDLAIKYKDYFTVVGRSKHMILSGGLNIFPAELENILIDHPHVADCVVFGIEDETWGELPTAAIVATDKDIDLDAVMEFVAERVARYKRVRQIFVIDEIQRTVAGKAQLEIIKKHCLRLLEENAR
jgi:acyl-CoA synthetase (AMP-forming)/AMP-acid ligase II